MDETVGITSAESSVTAAQSQSKLTTASGVVTVVSDATQGAVKPHPTGAETLNGGNVVMNCHVPGGGQPDSPAPASVTLVNGPASGGKEGAAVVSASPSPIIRTVISAQNAVTSCQPSVKTVPTVTLVRPHLQTANDSPSADNTTTPNATVNKTDSSKTLPQTNSQVLASTGATIRSPTVLQNLRISVPSTAAPPGGVRAIVPQVFAPRPTQPQQNATNVQNITFPPGMVLVCRETGRVMMIHQQPLAQIQAQAQSQSAMTPRPTAPTSTPPVQVTSLQPPGTPLMGRSVTPTTIIKQSPPVQTTLTATTTLQRPPVLQNTIMLGGGATSTGASTNVQSAGAQRVGATPTAVTAETLENVKKCKNFLSTLITLASGKQSTETTANVKELIKNLLDAKIEAEDFTSRLYRELNSSPQPFLVPFLKRSLPALRQMTPDSEAFLHQSLPPLPSAQSTATTSSALSAVVLRPPLSSVSTTTAATKTTVISLSQTPNSKPGLIVSQQQGTMVRPQVTLAPSPMVTFRGQTPNHIIVGQVVKQLPAAKQTVAPGIRGVQVLGHASLSEAQRNSLKEAAGGGTFKDDDDINDVASMAGVNLSEESANILATNSELVGIVTRSCKDETFLSPPSLSRVALQIGKRFGVSELGTDVISYISHATKQRLQNLLEKASHVAQQKNRSFKEDGQYEQVGDVRAQLKFFEQLDQMEKQRKEEQEREILLKAAKSRSRQEDPEQLRLKQKAKEMQQLELAQIRQREANLTALAAIGPRKKRKADSPVRGATAEGPGSGPSQPGASAGPGSRQFMRHRITRVNLRDLLFCLENEKETSHSQLLYKGFLK
uniref:TAF4 RNA polymerase II, TATA box binding protein (TBP)-associated factor, 135kDa n=2 Tax=Nothobranchius TaxID=28779 RepID=A0A1A8RMF7_9TELE